MRRTSKAGFTLVEILIVVVILGILAAIVVPQFTNASNEAVKGAIQSQLQTINSQMELYRVRNQGAYPSEVEDSGFLGEDNEGWGTLVGGEYLKEIPVNGYTGDGLITAGTEEDAMGEDRTSDTGWFFQDDPDAAGYGSVFAAGYDATLNLLAHEDGFGGE